MLAEVARAAAGPLLGRVQSVAVVDGFSWPAPDPARIVCADLGLGAGVESLRSALGGTGPIALLGDVSARIAAGELDVAIVAGAEAVTPFMAAMRAGADLGWPGQDEGAAPDRVVGLDREPSDPAELAAGLIAPIFLYPMFEHALRGAAGRTEDEHLAALAPWWARLSEVAAANPLAWSREALSAAAVVTPGPSNRRVSSPYLKCMNANIQVDQAAALLICREELVPEPLAWVRATAQAHDHWFVGERDALHRSPAIAACGHAALAAVGASIDDVGVLDLYSCFPSAVQIAAGELGIELGSRDVTVTGGLPFFGGPANDYVTHALATVAERLRDGGDAGALGLATAVGWYLTKHGTAILSAGPGDFTEAGAAPQAEVDALPRRAIAGDWSGSAPIETYTALYDRDGRATMGLVACVLPDGRRAFAKTHEPATIAALLDGDPLGREAALDGAAGFSL